MIRVKVPAAQLAGGALRLTGAEHHYVARVRRGKVGEAIELFDGGGAAAPARIVAIDAAGVELEVGPPARRERRGAVLRAVVPLLKGERMDLCIEKLVEVGCDRVTLWQAERSVVRLDEGKHAARVARIAARAEAAARQSGRAVVPAVEGLWTLAEVIARCDEPYRVALEPMAPPLAPAPLSVTAAALITGPEGGFAGAELEALAAAGFALASLTETVLRAETAPMLAVALWRVAERR